uniref:C-CAP/cofactor C-like domain-containing protein n=1 Tax=Setaria digitata TaxID=48799 RepID=A0A915PUY1_9BILA
MESEAIISDLESTDLVNERRQRMLARLEARHTQHTAQTKISSTDGADFDKLLAKAAHLINSSEENIEPEFLRELEDALTLIPPGHQSRRLKDALNVLRSKMQAQIGLTHQQTIFSFSAKKKIATGSGGRKAPISECNPLGSVPPSAKLRARKAITVTGEHEELIVKGEDGEEIVIDNVSNSLVRIPFKASAVHVKAVKHSTLIFAPIKTSLLMRDCKDLTVAVAAQQLRIHDSHQIRLYVEVCGALIIEDCDGIEVAPYNVTGLQQNPQNDNWRNVQDFSWLSTKECSPNWKVMEEGFTKGFSL